MMGSASPWRMWVWNNVESWVGCHQAEILKISLGHLIRFVYQPLVISLARVPRPCHRAAAALLAGHRTCQPPWEHYSTSPALSLHTAVLVSVHQSPLYYLWFMVHLKTHWCYSHCRLLCLSPPCHHCDSDPHGHCATNGDIASTRGVSAAGRCHCRFCHIPQVRFTRGS